MKTPTSEWLVLIRPMTVSGASNLQPVSGMTGCALQSVSDSGERNGVMLGVALFAMFAFLKNSKPT